ncbi:MAG: CoA pyrophosphatase [Fimbriimonadaceae bacterium]|nr:CoA pyrophosphatase [Chitinophagales bacterium]
MIEEFVNKLNYRIQQGLPGISAQQKMAPAIREIKPYEENEYPDAKKASVLILFYPHADDIYTVLMKRPDYDGVHSGQVSFPGGKVETTDKDPAYTALRETEEEVGIKMDAIQLMGKLSNIYIPPSNFFVFPYLGYLNYRPQFIPDKNEVAAIVETPIKIILDDSIKGMQEIIREDIKFNAPYYLIQNQKVWGATAIIMSELEILLKDVF